LDAEMFARGGDVADIRKILKKALRENIGRATSDASINPF
jgi:hypothetical protein